MSSSSSQQRACRQHIRWQRRLVLGEEDVWSSTMIDVEFRGVVASAVQSRFCLERYLTLLVLQISARLQMKAGFHDNLNNNDGYVGLFKHW